MHGSYTSVSYRLCRLQHHNQKRKNNTQTHQILPSPFNYSKDSESRRKTMKDTKRQVKDVFGIFC